MLPQALKNSLGLFVMEGEVIFGVDPHIVHVDLKPLLCNHVQANMVHECLEGGGCIAKAKEHDSWFEQPQRSYESGFPLIFFSKVDVVVSPMYVELGEDSGVFHIVNEFRDQG